MAAEWAGHNPGRPIFSTYELNLPNVVLLNPPFDDGLPILDASHGLMLIDEAALTFDSRMYQSTPIEMLHKLMQVRKYGLEVWWSTQHLEYVDKRLRLITFESYHCGSFAGLPIMPGFFATVRQGTKGGMQRVRIVRRTKARDALYDTHEIVNRAAYMNRKAKASAKT